MKVGDFGPRPGWWFPSRAVDVPARVWLFVCPVHCRVCLDGCGDERCVQLSAGRTVESAVSALAHARRPDSFRSPHRWVQKP